MNVLLLAHRVPYPPNKGEKIRTFHQLSCLVEQKYNITVTTPLEHSEDLTFAQQLRDKLDIEVIHANLPNRYQRYFTGLLKNKPLSATNFYSVELQNQIDALIETQTPDALMCTSSSMAEYVLNEKTLANIKRHGIRLVMDFMDLDSLKWQQYAQQNTWPLSSVYNREAHLLSKMEHKILTAFDVSLFVSEAEKNLLVHKQNNENNIQVVSNGVDTETYQPASVTQCSQDSVFSDSSPALLFAGVMDYYPNEQAVLWFADNVWPDVIANYPCAKFIIAGMRPTRKIKNLAARQGIEVTGFVESILPYYQQADFLVAPFSVARGIQNKVLQAMACGLPVISSPAGATGINCTSGVDVVIAHDKNDYLQALTRLLNDKQHYDSIRQQALKLVNRQYSWRRANAKLEFILSGKNPPAPVPLMTIEQNFPSRGLIHKQQICSLQSTTDVAV